MDSARKKTSMSVHEMAAMLGIKKTDSYHAERCRHSMART